MHDRKFIRLSRYDQRQARAYTVMIVGHNPLELPGQRQATNERWRAIPRHFVDVELGLFVVMPDNVHGIIVLR